MIDDPRDHSTTYRVSTTTYGELYKVTMYPKTPAPIGNSLYRLDLLPEWMRKGMEMLDVAGNDHEVPGVGRRTGSAYWFEAETKSNKDAIIQRVLNSMEDELEEKDSRMRTVGVDSTQGAD